MIPFWTIEETSASFSLFKQNLAEHQYLRQFTSRLVGTTSF